MFLRKHAAVVMAATVSCLVLGGCDNTDNGTGVSDQASVRFVNALSGGTGSLNLRVAGNVQGGNVTSGQFGTCQALTTGGTDFTFTQTGSSTVLATIPTQDLTAGTSYTIIATGSATTPTYLFLNDAFTTPAAGRARLRIVNAVGASTANNFDVYITTPPADLGAVNLPNVAFNGTVASQTNFLDVPAGQLQVRLTAAGNVSTVIGNSGTFTLNSGEAATLVVTGLSPLGGNGSMFLVPVCP